MIYPGDLQKENKSSLKGTNSTQSSKSAQQKSFKDNEQLISNKHGNHREARHPWMKAGKPMES